MVDTGTLPRVSVFAADIFSRCGYLDTCWVLGGMVCRTEDTVVMYVM